MKSNYQTDQAWYYTIRNGTFEYFKKLTLKEAQDCDNGPWPTLESARIAAIDELSRSIERAKRWQDKE